MHTAGRLPQVLVVGSGITGLSAAQALLSSGGVEVRIVDMGENPGGRLAVRDLSGTGTQWDGHIVDVGAAYFTVSDDDFCTQVEHWLERGLARPWFSTATVIDADGRRQSDGPMRYAATSGLRSLARDLLITLEADQKFAARFSTQITNLQSVGGQCHVTLSSRWLSPSHHVEEAIASAPEVTVESYEAVMIACPDPQALRIISAESAPALHSQLQEAQWEPVISHTMVFGERTWPEDNFWFVNDSAVITNIADDGARRGDGAAVLVAHSTAHYAVEYLANPDAAAPAMEAEVRRILGVTETPAYRLTKRWGLAQPRRSHQQTFGWDAERRLAVCGDSWSEKPRIEGAWVSGRAAARQVLAALSR